MNPLECKACFEEYHATTRRPRALPCGHSYCEPCLIILKTYQTIRCPTCRRKHRVPEVTELMIVYDLIELLDIKQTKTTVSLNKGECEEHGCPLNFFCATHQVWICRDCIVLEHPKERCSIRTKKQFLQGKVTEKKEKLTAEKVIHEKCHSHLKKKSTEIKKEITTRKELITKLQSLLETNVNEKTSLEIEAETIKNAIKETEVKYNELNSILPNISGNTDFNNLEVVLGKAEELMTKIKHWRENMLRKYPEKLDNSSNKIKSQHAELIKLSLKYTQQTTVQEGVLCDGCNISNFHGYRYSCLVCNDYNICSACEMTGFHRHYAKLRIPEYAFFIWIDRYSGILDSSGHNCTANGPENAISPLHTVNCWKPHGLPRYHNDWYILIDLESPHTIINVKIANIGDTKHDIEEFKLESSMDNEIFIPVGDKFVAEIGTNDDQYFGSFYATGRFWKFTVLKTPHGWETWLLSLHFQGY